MIWDVGGRRPLEIRGHRGRRGVGRGDRHGPALGGLVARRIVGQDPVAVARGLGETRVVVARTGGRGDKAAVAVDPVARDAQVVRRGRPGQVDLGRRGRRSLEVRRNRGRRGVGRVHRNRSALGRYISLVIVGSHAVAVACGLGKPRVGIARTRRARYKAPVSVDPVACHPRVVRRGAPGQIDPGCRGGRPLEIRGNRRRGCIDRCCGKRRAQ